MNKASHFLKGNLKVKQGFTVKRNQLSHRLWKIFATYVSDKDLYQI